jgi:CubicO group peptidase (beta-lactamase class C family)
VLGLALAGCAPPLPAPVTPSAELDGRIDWARGYGVAESGTARLVDTATLFQAASIRAASRSTTT